MTLSFHGYNYICISVFGKFKGLKQLLPVVIDKFILYFTSNYKVVNQYVDILGFSKLKKTTLTFRYVAQSLSKAQNKYPQCWVVEPVHEFKSIKILQMRCMFSVVPTLITAGVFW